MRAALAAVFAVALAACAATSPAAQPNGQAEAEAAVRAYTAAFAEGNFEAAAERIDPVELAQFVGLLEPLMALSGAPADAGPVPERAPAAFAWFLETMGGMTPGLTDAMQTTRADVLGSVAEGDSLVHVVVRTRARVMGLDTEGVSTTTARRRDGRWVVALSGDLRTFSQAVGLFGEIGDGMGEDGGDPGSRDRKRPPKPGRDE